MLPYPSIYPKRERKREKERERESAFPINEGYQE